MIKLGLIGQSISKSKAPSLHTMLAELHGISIDYQLHTPKDNTKESFIKTLDFLIENDYRGCNVTYPYKRVALELSKKCDPIVHQIGATNTLRFIGKDSIADNTDYSGFVRGYHSRIGNKPAGRVLLLGAGGVGHAVAYALFKVGASCIDIYDLNDQNAETLASSLVSSGFTANAIKSNEIASAAIKADGIVNCTPIGHHATPGMALDASFIGQQSWAFDAVYTPIDTEFLRTASEKGVEIMSGFDLFFYQGLDAFQIFTDISVDPDTVLDEFKNRFNISSNILRI